MGDAKEVTGSPKSVSKQHDSTKLRDRICRATLSVTSSRCWTQFVPVDEFNELVTEESIEAEIPDSPRELIEFIYNDAKKVFMTVLDIKEHDNQSELESMMQSFRASGFTDKHLPIRNPRDPPAEHNNSHHFPALPPDTFNHEKWTMGAKERFYRSQWTFLAPIFTEGKLKHDFPQETMLPFTEIFPLVREGFFSSVTQVKIHPAHQKVLCKENGKAPCFAIKELKYLVHEPGYDPAKAWELEANSLHQIGKLNDSHLIKPVAAYKIGIRHCFIFEWAEGGTLWDYWKNHRHPVLDKALILNVLKQLLGLAKALEVLHTGNGADNHSEDEERSESHWRHGDLKPDNILRFQDISEVKELGELRIADLGLAKLHTFRTNARHERTGTRYLTTHYEPPEAFTLPTKPRSRLYDVWSMGCVILEFIIWLLYGSDFLDEFVGERLGQHEDGTIYYLVEGLELPSPSARMNEKIASKWMDDILPADPDCQPEKTAIGDLLMMVKTKLLVIKLPNDGSGSLTPSRASARSFRTCIEDILKRATDDEKYAFIQRDRTGLEPSGWQTVAKQPQEQKPQSVASPALLSPAMARRPSHTQREAGNISQNITYTHLPFNDDWIFHLDNAFATSFLRQIEQQDIRSTSSNSQQLCDRCRLLCFRDSPMRLEQSGANLCGSISNCPLCKLLLELCERLGVQKIHMRKDGSIIRKIDDGRPVLSICSEASHENIQVGLPNLPVAGSRTHFRLMRQWLKNCNENHVCCSTASGFLPTRVIDVGKRNAPTVRLYSPKEDVLCKAPGKDGGNQRFIALSHRWGDANTNDSYCTLKRNVVERKVGISLCNLPKTFQDAVTITRELDVQYLWIDSLCIIQDDGEDWGREATLMEDVFSSAYCVLAASCSSGISDGFLKGPSARKSVIISELDPPIYVCEFIDDFDRQVLQADLNKRGWVLQERALARRTIHFAEEQTYWECGDGVRCETLTKMSNRKAAFLGDPGFPDLAIQASKGGRIRLFQMLYQHYSRLALSHTVDRPLAIAGLEKRMIHALHTHAGVYGGYGILKSNRPEYESLLGRSLLWQRGSGGRVLERIKPNTRIPSWSWMAYEGPIDYVELPFGKVYWYTEEIKVSWDQSTQSSPWHTGDRSNPVKLRVACRDFTLNAGDRVELDDCEKTPDDSWKCVPIGSTKDFHRRYYVLLLHPKAAETQNGCWERVGVGLFLASSISFVQKQWVDVG